MTTQTQTPPPPAGSAVESRLLDRLVDGELDEGERQRLLLSLDAEPDGWRRCALAFLEAQALQQAFRSAPARAGTDVKHLTWPDRQGSRRVPRRLLSLAAVVLIAFGVGFVTAPVRHPGAAHRDGTNPAGTKSEGLHQSGGAFPATWLMTSDRDGRAVPIPLFPAGGAETSPLATQPAIPEYVRRQLERQGYEVRNDRKLVSVALKDGRTATVPVETVQYRFVGQRVY